MMHCFSIRPSVVSCEDMDAQHVIGSHVSTQDASNAKVLDSTTQTIDSDNCMKSRRTKTRTKKGSESSMELEQTSKLGARYFSVGMNPGALLWWTLNKDEVLNWVVVVHGESYSYVDTKNNHPSDLPTSFPLDIFILVPMHINVAPKLEASCDLDVLLPLRSVKCFGMTLLDRSLDNGTNSMGAWVYINLMPS